LDVEKQLAALLFPEGLLDYFTVVSVSKNKDHYIFHLDEKNIAPRWLPVERFGI